jgi:cation-transporting ATPase E
MLQAGLSTNDVRERERLGLVNRTRTWSWRDYAAIVARNVVTWFNALVIPATIVLFQLGEYRGAVAVSGMMIVNTLIGLVQEIAAKIRLDRLSLLSATRVNVIRSGEIQNLASDEVVQDDVIQLTVGEYIIADGSVLEANFLEVDEALLTGESDPVSRQVGDRLLAGSFCVAGTGYYRAEKVGAAITTQQMAQEARQHRYVAGPIQRSIDRIVRWLSYAAILLCLIYLFHYWQRTISEVELAEMVAATVTSMVPQGFVLAATLALTWGAIRLSRQGAIVQRLDAVEAMAAVNVLCMDKTGTLTTNRLQLERLILLDQNLPDETVRHRLRLFVSAAVDRTNKVLSALRISLSESTADKIGEIPFKSQNRFSVVQVRDQRQVRTLVLGASEVLRSYVDKSIPTHCDVHWKECLESGLRLLLFLECDEAVTLDDFDPNKNRWQPLALLGFRDELRPEAAAALTDLHAQGIDFKVLSGDQPQTVHSTLSALAVPINDDLIISGPELAQAQDPLEIICRCKVFGRLAPQQKQEIISSLQQQGHFVAMLGDGVNDILSIKQADLGIAMGAGAAATKTVAGLVLMHDDFSLLPAAMTEARIVVHNLRHAGKLFLVKNVYTVLLVVLSMITLAVAFPYLPQQVTLLNLLTIGLPAAIITFGRDVGPQTNRRLFLREIVSFAVTTGVIVGLAGCVLLALSAWWRHDPPSLQRTLLLALLIFLVPQTLIRGYRYVVCLSSWDTFLLLGVTVLALPLYATAVYLKASADFFRLEPLGGTDWILVVTVLVPAMIVLTALDWVLIQRVKPR